MFINEIDTWIAFNGVTANQQQVMALHLTGAAKEWYYNEFAKTTKPHRLNHVVEIDMLQTAQHHKVVTQAVPTDGRNDYGMHNNVQQLSTHWQCTCCNYTLHNDTYCHHWHQLSQSFTENEHIGVALRTVPRWYSTEHPHTNTNTAWTIFMFDIIHHYMYTMHSLETIIIVARTSDRTGTLGVSTFGLTMHLQASDRHSCMTGTAFIYWSYQHANIHRIITIVIQYHLWHITIFFNGGEDVVTTLPAT